MSKTETFFSRAVLLEGCEEGLPKDTKVLLSCVKQQQITEVVLGKRRKDAMNGMAC